MKVEDVEIEALLQWEVEDLTEVAVGWIVVVEALVEVVIEVEASVVVEAAIKVIEETRVQTEVEARSDD